MSSHGRTGLQRWVYGSVAEKVLRSACCATMIVRNQLNLQDRSNKAVMDRLFVIAGFDCHVHRRWCWCLWRTRPEWLLSELSRVRATYDTAVRYQMIHGIALFFAAWVAVRYSPSFANWAGYLFILGIVLFSGSLYLLVFTRTSWLGAVTPVGGTAFLSGWVLLALAAWRAQ